MKILGISGRLRKDSYNTLIIKDRRSLVKELVRVIKGPDKVEDDFLNCQKGPPKLD